MKQYTVTRSIFFPVNTGRKINGHYFPFKPLLPWAVTTARDRAREHARHGGRHGPLNVDNLLHMARR